MPTENEYSCRQAISLALLTALMLSSCATSAQTNKVTGTAVTKRTWSKPALSPDKPLILVYPPEQGQIAAASSFLVGATYPGYGLVVNGQKVQVNKDGYFAHVVPLQPGKNAFRLTVLDATNNQIFNQDLSVNREKARSFISEKTFCIDKNSTEPKEALALPAGEIIELAVRATPNCHCYAMLGNKKIPLKSFNLLRSKSGKETLNRGMEAAYGQVFQRYSRSNPDLYIGLYRLEAGDNFRNEHIRYFLEKPGKSETISALGNAVTVIKQPQVAHTLHNDTISRTAPDQTRLTPLPEGVRLLVDGYQGDNIRCQYSPRKHAWIKKDELQFEETAAIPQAVARTIIVKKDDYGETLVVPLSQRLPFTIDQELKPNKLTVKLYGVQADTDWAYQSPELSSSRLLDEVGFKQSEDGVYELNVELKGGRQWGFWADYDDNNFNLHIKNPPRLTRLENSDTPTNVPRLQGLSIVLDPGHGGGENGAIGCSGEREADLNLAIALKFRDLLRAEGVNVIMTREGDQEVSLGDRVALANDKKVDLLISIHNNALPDGRDPAKEHGTSSYWYHKQSKELARALKNGLVKEVGLPDIGDRWQNLALCRPSAMPAVLMEVAFMVNPDEYAKLTDPSFQDKAAHGLLNGLLSYFGRN